MDKANESRRAEDALRRSEAEYRSLFEAAGIGNAEADLDSGRFIRVNRRFCELVGYSADELLGGMTFLQITHADDRQRNIAVVEASMREQQGSFEIEKRYVRKDGSVVWVLLTATLIRDADGNATRLLGSAHDVTDRRRAEQGLRTAHDTFRHLVDNSPFGIYVVDADFRLVRVSVGAQKVFQNVRPLLGRDFAEVLRCIWPEPFATEAIGRFRHTLATGEPYHSPSTVERRRDIGDIESYDWKTERVTLPDGRSGVVCHFYDLSERQRYEAALRESRGFLESVVETSPALIVVTDEQGRIVLFNRACEELTGYSRDEVVGRSIADMFLPPDWKPVVAARYADLDAPEVRAPHVNPWRTRFGEERLIEWRCIVLPGGPDQPRRVLGAGIDITEHKRAEEALLDADRRKDEFLATLAHELRNPLAPVMNSLELLDRLGSHEAIAIEARATMRRQIEHLVRLVDDLLDISRITRGQLELRKGRVELASVVDHAVEANRPFRERRGHELTVSLPSTRLWLDADAIRLAQVLSNLLHNACKYTPSDGKISLSAWQDGSAVRVAVTDNGIGIAPADLPRVFETFTQVHNDTSLSQGGMGIGLWLVKRLIEMHDGSVTARSDGVGKGCTFELRLPVAEEVLEASLAAPDAADATAVAAPIQTDSSGKRRILVVDDNKDAARALARLLVLGGARTDVVHDGPDAIAAAERFEPDLVLLDIGLPTMSGYDVCRAIRARRPHKPPVMIALTGWGQEEDRRRSLEAGFDHHLVKPVSYDNLNALLQELSPQPNPSRGGSEAASGG